MLVPSVVILETVLLILLYSMFRLLPIEVHNMNKTAAEINFHLTKSRKAKGFVNCTMFKNVLPHVTTWFTSAVSVLLSWYWSGRTEDNHKNPHKDMILGPTFNPGTSQT
jgi:hypothetical protein